MYVARCVHFMSVCLSACLSIYPPIRPPVRPSIHPWSLIWFRNSMHFWYPRDHYCVHKIPPLHSFRCQFTISHLTVLRSIFIVSSHQSPGLRLNSYAFIISPVRFTSHPPRPPSLDHSNNIWREVLLMTLLVM
jgi:hypothetical protein